MPVDAYRRTLLFNNIRASEQILMWPMPVPHISAGHAIFIATLNLVAALPGPPELYFFIRGIEGFTVASYTWWRLGYRWPTLRIRLIFVARQRYLDLGSR